MADAPSFLYARDRKKNKEFVSATKNDIIETIKFLYKRGMWSKYHYTHWMEEAKKCNDEETLHLWWDAIVGGAMFEVEPLSEARMEALEDWEEDQVETEKMMQRRKHIMKKRLKMAGLDDKKIEAMIKDMQLAGMMNAFMGGKED